MNGSTLIELIDTFYWDIMADYVGIKESRNMTEEQADKIARSEKWQKFAERWITENV
jgi:hypothetical protein